MSIENYKNLVIYMDVVICILFEGFLYEKRNPYEKG